jgi:hypothetical protein
MIKRTILSVVALCASAMPAQANIYSLVSNNRLTRTVEASGVRVVYDTEYCFERGSYGYYMPKSKVLGLCVLNHDGDIAELGDTLRHEAIHVAQTCYGNGKARPILSWTQISKYSNNRILSIVQRYRPEHQHIEYEAFTAAATMTNNQVADIVTKFCF